MHYKGAAGALIVFDLTDQMSYRHTLDWLAEFRQQAPEKAKVVLVGNKLDLVEVDPTQRCVDKKFIKQMADTSNMLYIETSAAVDKHVHEAFHVLLQGSRPSRQRSTRPTAPTTTSLAESD